MLGSKSLLKRVTTAVQQSLEADEVIVVAVYVRDTHFALASVLLGLPAPGSIDTWIVTATNRRVIVHQGNNLNAARSTYLGSAPRDRVTVLAADPPAAPAHVTLSFDGDAGHRFEVPLVWRKQAALLVRALATPGS